MKKMLCLLLLFASFANAAAYVISDGDYDHGLLKIENYDTLLVTGGGAYQIDASDYSSIVVQNTAPLQVDIGGIADISLNGWSSLEIFGGEVGHLRTYSHSTTTLSGGSISKIFSYQRLNLPNPLPPHIEIICREYTANSSLVTGIWDVDNDNDGFYDTFSINLENQSGYDPVLDNIKFTIVPEPISLVLLGVGGLVVRRKR